MLCIQTLDTSIDLYWQDGMLRSPPRSGAAPATHIPRVEEFADRLARKMHGEQGALWFEVLNRTASAHFIGGITIGERAVQAGRLPDSAVLGRQSSRVLPKARLPGGTRGQRSDAPRP